MLSNYRQRSPKSFVLTQISSLNVARVVNYWDSSISALPINPSGTLGQATVLSRPLKAVVAGRREDHLHNRQSEPHAHALVLDPAMVLSIQILYLLN